MSLIESIMNEQNSKFWWNEYFKKKWDNLDGRKQTRFFMQTIVSNLPNPVINKISKYRSVLDWGCALGQGVDVLTKTFTKTKIFGLDFSTIAIDKAKELYPKYNFYSDPLEKINKKFDCIIASNCLEHFSDPLKVLKNHLEFTNYIYILLTPFEEINRIESHKITFYKKSFPKNANDFKRLFRKVINTSRAPYWTGNQILVVYVRHDIERLLKEEIIKDMIKENKKLKNQVDNVGFEMQNMEREYNSIIQSTYFRLWQYYCRVRDQMKNK